MGVGTWGEGGEYRTKVRMTKKFSSETIQTRRWKHISKVLKETRSRPEF